MQKQFEQLEEWAEVMKAHRSLRPTAEIPATVAQMRYDTMLEEVEEYADAIEKGDIVKIADALCDLLYFLIGTVQAHGLQDVFEDCFDEVHRSNMSKRQPDGTIIYREDGKVLKPSTWSPPDLESIIRGTKNEGN